MSSYSFVIIVQLGDVAGEDDNDQDTLKETLLETNPYLLGLTIIVSILHSVFEFLAFKNGKYKNTSDICTSKCLMQAFVIFFVNR